MLSPLAWLNSEALPTARKVSVFIFILFPILSIMMGDKIQGISFENLRENPYIKTFFFRHFYKFITVIHRVISAPIAVVRQTGTEL